MNFHNLKIKVINRDIPDAVIISFEIPLDLKDNFRFSAGQHVFIEKKIDGEIYKRAYSITSSPSSKLLQIAIKKINTGLFSIFANSELKEDDILKVSTPKGSFILATNPRNKKNYFGFATGSGIAPIYGMIQAVLENEPLSKFGLVYGNKNAESTLFKSELKALKEEYPKRFSLLHMHSQDRDSTAINGRINENIVKFVVFGKFNDLLWDHYYICGQEELKEMVFQNLTDSGVEKDMISFELFNKEKKEEEIAITIVLDGEKTQINAPSSETLLEAALDADIDVPYSCSGGFCVACKAKITQGKATMENNETLNDEEIAAGYILTCVAKATTKSISINYDQ